MRKEFVIQDLQSKLYWYGNYTSKNWCEDINEAKYFDSIEDAENSIVVNELTGFFTIIPVYIS